MISLNKNEPKKYQIFIILIIKNASKAFLYILVFSMSHQTRKLNYVSNLCKVRLEKKINYIKVINEHFNFFQEDLDFGKKNKLLKVSG